MPTPTSPDAAATADEVYCWTWPVTDHVHDQITATVADAYEKWGRTPHSAALLGQLAAELAQSVPPGPYVAVIAAHSHQRVTLSALTADGPADAAAYAIHPGDGPTAWGVHSQVGATAAYAVINRPRPAP